MMKPAPQVGTGGAAMDDVYFAFDQYALSESSKATLRRNAEWLKARPGVNVKIEGHADERGPSAYNLKLGQKRADEAAKYLRSLGIESHRITTVSFGETRLADRAHNAVAWSKNRRDEFNSISADTFTLTPE